MSAPLLLAKIINDAQTDEKIKVILLHGGKFFSSGNNLSVMASMGSLSKEEAR